MVQIKFIAQGSNSLIGGFSSGDKARVSEAFAKHLVEEAKVASYCDQPVADQVAVPEAAEQKRVRKVKVK